jgi:hypothetical protein
MRRFYVSLLALLAAVLLTIQPVWAAPDAASVFRRVWERQDQPVENQVANRSWTWGRLVSPIVLGTAIMREAFVDIPGGSREVLYFDKSRMEINNPNADANATWYVTNGLLPVELITGKLQIGYNQFEDRRAATIAAIGDPGQFPTYADVRRLFQSPGAVNPGDLGKPATGFLNTDGSISGFNGYANDAATLLVRGENNHGVAKAFIDFMNQRGMIYEDGRYIRDQVYDPLFVFGLPVTGAYWVKVRVGGIERPILFQVFERRVLTYNPANPVGWQVEMGNVGQHYFEWRYGYRPF